MTVQVFCVLRSGGRYSCDHVTDFNARLKKYLPGYWLNCLADPAAGAGNFYRAVVMQYNWPKWWAKMELFRPDITGDILYFDIDCFIIRDISDFTQMESTTVLTDFTDRRKPSSAIMYLPETDRAQVWEQFIADPDSVMAKYKGVNDYFAAEFALFRDAYRWDKIFPAQIVPFDIVKNSGKPSAQVRIVTFGWRPSPWEVNTDGWMT